MTADEIFDEIVRVARLPNQRARRRFLPGLLAAFVSVIRTVRPDGRLYQSLAEFYADFPRQTTTADGSRANTLILAKPDGSTISIRPAYRGFEKWIREDNHRHDYPSAAPHATQAWIDYEQSWLASLISMPDVELDNLVERVRAWTLEEYVSQEVDPSTLRRDPPLFKMFLEEYDFAQRGAGQTGAAYQGTVFAYMRADAPHLQVQVSKVRTGSKRLGKVGDVDARDGAQLVAAAEVKQFHVAAGSEGQFDEFAALVHRQGALGLVVALSFDEDAKAAIREMGLEPVSKADLLDRVRLWDTLKQRIAVQALLFYATQVEVDSRLIAAINGFFALAGQQAEPSSLELPNTDA